MLKRFTVIAVLVFALLLSACTGDSGAVRDSSAKASELIAKATENLLWENEIYDSEDALMSEFDQMYFYGVTSGADFAFVVSEYGVAAQSGTSTDEIGIFKINTDFDAEGFRAQSDLTGDALERAVKTEQALFIETNLTRAQEFCRYRVDTFLTLTENYDRTEYDKAQNALIATYGYYVYYIISGDNAAIEDIIKAQIDAKAI